MYCSRCGTSLAEGSTICTSCGAPIGSLTPPAGANAPSPAPVGAPVATPMAGYPPSGAIAMAPGAMPPGTMASGATPMVYVPVMPYAGFWLRAVAYLLDVILVSIVTVPIVIALAVATGLSAAIGQMSENDAQNVAAAAGFAIFLCLLIIIMLCGLWLYYSLLESSTWQGTVGKKLLGLMVTDLEGKRVTFGRATARFFSRLITALIPLLIGYILAGVTANKQALHDMIAGCLVLRRE